MSGLQVWQNESFLLSFKPLEADARGRIFSAGYNNERSTPH